MTEIRIKHAFDWLSDTRWRPMKTLSQNVPRVEVGLDTPQSLCVCASAMQSIKFFLCKGLWLSVHCAPEQPQSKTLRSQIPARESVVDEYAPQVSGGLNLLALRCLSHGE